MDNSANFAHRNGNEIAIIGMTGRFPGAKTVDELWKNLQNSVDSISFLTDEAVMASGRDPAVLNDPNFVKATAALEDVELFDASFFGFNPREAEITEPQHRIFLECAWEALESAGYDSEQYKGLIGVYAGADLNTYYLNFYYNPTIMGSVEPAQILVGNDKDYLTSRVSYKLNLEGPSFTVQTACSTSLVAVHLACQSLLNGECDMALAGGVSINSSREAGYFYTQEGVFSPEGRCRAFDAKAQGIIFGEGVGIVVLKRLEDALADGDCIHAVIKGSAINNDGSLKVSYTAPSIDGQAKAIALARDIAEVDPETITYIETHGTGTSLGDPIEIAALTQAFRTKTEKKGFCAIGSVKANIGHLGSAAGVTGLIKSVLALKHKQIPASLHFEEPNPKIDFANSPFYVNTALSDWKTNGTPRRAGVSAFGFGGTNAHVILEEAPTVEASEATRPWHLLVLSAKTPSALETATENLTDYLKQHPDLNLPDVAYTLQVSRRSFSHRRMVVCKDVPDAIAALQDPKRVLTGIQETSESVRERPVAFMFTGLGTHYVNMAGELYQVEPTFREQVDRCCSFLKPLLDLDLTDVLYPSQNKVVAGSQAQTPFRGGLQSGLDLRQMLGRDAEQPDAATQKLNQTYLTQPALFVIEYALAQLWQSWGIRPAALIGYSIGEYVAACLAGVLSLEDALTLVARRSQLIQELPGGAMLAVPLSEQEVYPLLNENLSLSAINGPSLCVIAGTLDAVDELAQQLSEQGLACRRLQTSHAFHSQMMEPIATSFTELVKTVSLQPPQIPYVSNVTGTWITADQATDPSYWAKHLCQPVRFADGVREVWKQSSILLEVGPGQTLGSLARQCLESDRLGDRTVVPSLRYSYDRQPDLAFLLNTLGQLWLSGVQIDWSGFYDRECRQRIPLPTYPFERQRYWIEPQKSPRDINLERGALEQKLDIANWFYIPSWKRSIPPVEIGQLTDQKQCWLVFIDACGVGSQLVERLEREHQDVIVVRIGEQFARLSDREYAINPQNRDDYDVLIKALQASGTIPQIIAHLWNITPSDSEALLQAADRTTLKLKCFEKAQHLGFYSLLFLAQALGECNSTDSLQIGVVSNNMQQLLDEEELCPEKATLLGPCRVISQEYSNITCRSIDITLPHSSHQQWQQPIDQLLVELAAKTSDPVVAYRGNHRWVQCFEPLVGESQPLRTARLRPEGVYIITGGLGGIGLAIAEYLAKTVQAKLVLIGRSGLPPRAEWEQWLSSHDELSTKIKKVQALEELGAEVLVIKADVSSLEQMQETIARVCDRFGEIHGVIHAAGVPGAGLVQLKTPEMAARVLAPKVQGTLVLDAVLKEVRLDFFVLFSSITSIYGGLGQVDYCAANAFLDAFAHYSFSRHQRLTVSINWDWWQWDSWQDSLLSFAPKMQAWFKQMRENYGITFQEGVDALLHILSAKLPQVVVSTRNLQAVIEQHEDFDLVNLLEKSEKSHLETSERQYTLKTAYVAPSNEIERTIARVYQELLGIEQVGIHDNFFDLGGHSLIAIKLISQLRKDLQVELSLRSLFEAPTVAELALVIEDILVTELEALTDDEAKEIVSKIPNKEPSNQSSVQRYCTLPNNLEIAYQVRAEADYFYEDIFENRVYLKHGITLKEGDCIFDVGANIGMFTLFVNQQCKNTTIYAFEPAPPLFEILRLNTTLHNVNAKLFNYGVSNKTQTATFTFYPNSSGMSSFYADREEEKEVLKAIMLNQLQSGMAGMEQVMEYSDELLEERFKGQVFTCQLRTLSDLIVENSIESIDLLKIDVQKSEFDVIQGIKEQDWKKIKQIVMEVHDIEGRLEQITNLLKRRGYNVVSEQEDLYEGSVIHNIYAVQNF
ncbi:MAG: FkbM family methyltransferase [Coleofasciculus sp. Co-bin14]|nr:FkbM family methyltransferase [Coleofasciculus sp. Co-bin14]